MKKNYKSVLILVILCMFFVICIFHSDLFISEFLRYTSLFFKRIYPPSFIFLTISSLLIDYQFLSFIQVIFKKNSSYLYVFFFSLISGFPSGAFLIKELLNQHKIDLDMANQMILYAHFPNPLFVFSSITFILGSFKESFCLLLSIILSNFLIFLFISKKNSFFHTKIQFPISFVISLQKNIFKSIRTILLIYGISISFNMLAYSIEIFFHLSNVFKVFISGFFDLTRGIFSISLLNSFFLRRFFSLFFISFGSISIHMQTKSILSDTSCYSHYFLGRVIGFLLSCVFFTFILFVGKKFFYFQ